MAVVGTIEYTAIINTKDFDKGISDVKSGLRDVENSSGKMGDAAEKSSGRANKAFTSIGKVGVAAIGAAFVAATALIVSNVDNAVKRIDTLIAFPRVLESLGVSSEQAQKSMGSLKEQLKGLPTTLDAGARGVQGFITAGLDVNTATDGFLAFNNAMLAAGVSADVASQTQTQFNQALARGKIEGEEWNSITANMPTALMALQKESGLSKEGLKELYRENPQQLIDDLIRLNKEGGGGIASLDEQARAATGGIGTAFDNMNAAVTRGIEGIVRSIGGGDLEAGQKKISDFITSVGVAFEKALGYVGPLINFIAANSAVFLPILAGITAIIAAATTWLILTKAWAVAQMAWSLVMGVWQGIVAVATVAQWLWNAALLANPIGLIIIAVVAFIAAIVLLWNNVEGFRNFFKAAWEIIKNAVVSVFNWVKENWPLLLAILTGPIGLAVLAIVKNWDTIKNAFKAAWEFIKSVWSAVAGWFGNVWNGIKNAFGAVGSWFKGIFQDAWNGIKKIWDGAVSFFSGLPGKIVSGFSSIGTTLASPFKTAFNSIARLWNNTVGKLSFNLPDWVPGMGGKGFSMPKIPEMAKGGIVNGPMNAIIGEAGKEVVLPLENNTGWMDDLADKIGGGGPTTVVVKIGEETIATRVIDLINDRTRLSGNNAILV